MSKAIKVSDVTYQELQRIQRPRESFSEIIERLLGIAHLMAKAEPLIRGQQELLESKRADLEQLNPVD